MKTGIVYKACSQVKKQMTYDELYTRTLIDYNLD